jgi:hypothetical protein
MVCGQTRTQSLLTTRAVVDGKDLVSSQCIKGRVDGGMGPNLLSFVKNLRFRFFFKLRSQTQSARQRFVYPIMIKFNNLLVVNTCQNLPSSESI